MNENQTQDILYSYSCTRNWSASGIKRAILRHWKVVVDRRNVHAKRTTLGGQFNVDTCGGRTKIKCIDQTASFAIPPISAKCSDISRLYETDVAKSHESTEGVWQGLKRNEPTTNPPYPSQLIATKRVAECTETTALRNDDSNDVGRANQLGTEHDRHRFHTPPPALQPTETNEISMQS